MYPDLFMYTDKDERLLDHEGKPRVFKDDKAMNSFSQIASSIHNNADSLNTDQLEIIVHWLKEWKMHKKGLHEQSFLDFQHEFGPAVDKEVRDIVDGETYQKMAKKRDEMKWCSKVLMSCGILVILLPMFLANNPNYEQLIAASLFFWLSSSLCYFNFSVSRTKAERYLFLRQLWNAKTFQGLTSRGFFHVEPEQLVIEQEELARLHEKITDAMYFCSYYPLKKQKPE